MWLKMKNTILIQSVNFKVMRWCSTYMDEEQKVNLLVYVALMTKQFLNTWH